MPVTKILWVSRHFMTDDQKKDLERIYGQIKITQYDKTISDVHEIKNAGDYDVYAVVLTGELVAQLKKIISENQDILQPVSERVYSGKSIINPATGITEKEYEYKHRCWRKIIKAEFETIEL